MIKLSLDEVISYEILYQRHTIKEISKLCPYKEHQLRYLFRKYDIVKVDRKRHVSPSISKEKLISLLETKSRAEILDILTITTETLSRLKTRLGLKTKLNIGEVYDLFKQGFKQKSLAIRFGVSNFVIRGAIKKAKENNC